MKTNEPLWYYASMPCSNDVYSDELSSAGAQLLCTLSRPCISSYGYCISSHFWIFVSAIGKSLWRKPTLISGMALQTIGYLFLSPISLTESYLGGLLGPMLLIGLRTGLGFTATNIAALTGTRRGEEGLASGLINTSRQISGPIGLAVLLTVVNFETLAPTGHQLVQSAVAIVTGFGYAFLAATTLMGIWIILTILLIQERHRQAGVATSATVHQS